MQVNQTITKLNRLEPGLRFTLGPASFTEAEIIELAQLIDPNRVHIDPEFAKASRFGGIIACGLHAYIYFHKRYWIEMVGDNLICGIKIESVNFYLPVYPDHPVTAEVSIVTASPNPEKQTTVVQWQWRFIDARGELIQDVLMTTLHKLITEPIPI